MNRTSRFSHRCLLLHGVLVVVAAVLSTGTVRAQFAFGGFPFDSKKFSMRVDGFGYSDSWLDSHRGFKGREYLSGESAFASYYEGGRIPPMVRWLNPMFVFPDKINPLPHYINTFGGGYVVSPMDEHGFYTNGYTIITNLDTKITITCDIMDLGMNEMDRVPIGVVPASAGGLGSNILSGRYVFRQRFQISNISGLTLSNYRFYQFIHSLQGEAAVYDNRDYGGVLPSYHHSLTQWGDSMALHSKHGTTYSVRDYLAVSARLQPAVAQVGSFASTNHQSHWPETGTVAAIESNSLTPNDQVSTNASTRFVCGAMRFDLGTLAPGGTTNIDFILSVSSFYTMQSNPPVNVEVQSVYRQNNSIRIVARETTGNPYLDYVMRYSTDLTERLGDWQPVSTLTIKNSPQMGWNTIVAPSFPGVDKYYLNFGVTIDETPF